MPPYSCGSLLRRQCQRVARARVLAAALACAIATPATAQLVPRDDPQRWPGRDLSAPAEPAFELPTVPKSNPSDKLSASPRVAVRRIRLLGNSVFPADELAAIAAPYENRIISSEQLQTLRIELTRHYIDNGYINSGAVIPDQSVKDGVVEIHLVEGRLAEVMVADGGRLRDAYVANRLHPGDVPLDVNRLRSQMQTLLRDPLIDGINSELVPGDRPGEAVLKTQIREASLLRLTAGIDNRISPVLGEVRGVLNAQLRNPSGHGDLLFAEVAVAEGSNSVQVDYELPLNPLDTRLLLGFYYNDAEVVEAPFDEIDVASRGHTLSIGISHPVIRDARQQLTLGLRFEHRESTTFLLDRRFSFARGAEDGDSKVSVLRVTGDWLDRGTKQVVAARSTFSVGLDALGATRNSGGLPDGQFIAWLGQFQWIRRFGERGNQLLFRANGQISNKPLLPLERFGVGGLDSVRGYRYNQLVRDQGFTTSLEARWPVLRDVTGRNKLQLVTFVDAGGARNKRDDAPKPDLLWSIGAGLRFDPTSDVQAELYWAHALEDIDNPNESIQDSGVHFRLRAGVDLF